jgi:hypothetical protein
MYMGSVILLACREILDFFHDNNLVGGHVQIILFIALQRNERITIKLISAAGVHPLYNAMFRTYATLFWTWISSTGALSTATAFAAVVELGDHCSDLFLLSNGLKTN